MEYHQPDETWTIWVKTYEEFVSRWVIKGRFHKRVPEDVVKSFLIVEYIMAHSWYHYPLYDEALTKIAGIVEMSIKLRCSELNLPLTAPDKKGVEKKLRLEKLIDAILLREPGKDLDSALHHMRRVRNIVAHPEQYGFTGGTQWHLVRHCVNILNTLFMPEKKCTVHADEKKRVNTLLSNFFPACSVLHTGGKKFLVENVHIVLALDPGTDWRYLLVAHPVYNDLEKTFKEQAYLPLFCFEVKDLVIVDRSVKATLAEEHAEIFIEGTSHPADMEVYNRFNAARTAANVHDRYIFDNATVHQPKLDGSEMNYRYLAEIGNQG